MKDGDPSRVNPGSLAARQEVTPHSFRRCERSEAIQNPAAATVWIATLRSQ
jgi:hypothetical protein